MLALFARLPMLPLAFLTVAAPNVPTQHEQKATIEWIEIRGNHRYPEDVLRPRIKSKPGDTFDEVLLKLDLRSLYETGFFEKIEMDKKDGDTGQIIAFQVTEKPVIRAIEFVRFEPLRMSDVEACFKERKIDFTVDRLFDPSKLRSAQKALAELLAQHGQRPEALRTELEQLPPCSIRVRFILGDKGKTPEKQ
jgi:outer membrane protein insertion porin family